VFFFRRKLEKETGKELTFLESNRDESYRKVWVKRAIPLAAILE